MNDKTNDEMNDEIDIVKYQEAKAHLLVAYNLLCPGQKEQLELINILHKMKDDNISRKLVLRTVVGAIYDGLAYNNW